MISIETIDSDNSMASTLFNVFVRLLQIGLLVARGWASRLERAHSGERPTSSPLGHHEKFLGTFAGHVLAENYGSAYDLCSTRYRNKVPLEEFSEVHRSARAQYGIPKDYRIYDGRHGPKLYSVGPDELYLGIPENEQLQDMMIDFRLEDFSGDDAYVCCVLVVSDGGEERVGWFEYTYYD